MNDTFSTWLDRELKHRGWSHRQLGEKAHITGAAISAAISGDRNPGWDLCKAIAKPLGMRPEDVFRIAGLLDEEDRGHNEAELLHHYRRLPLGAQSYTVAMLRGLAGQQAPALRQAQDVQQPPAPATQPPAQGADIDAVCKMLARLDSSRLEMAAIFIRWLIEQPGAGEPESAESEVVTWEDFERALASLPNEKKKTSAMNLLRRYAQQFDYDLRALGDTDSESDQAPRPGLGQGSLF